MLTPEQDVDTRLARIEEMLDQAPALIAALADTVDDLAGRINQTDAPMDRRVDGLVALTDQLTRPETSLALARTAARLEAIEGSIAALAELPAVIASVTDVLDEAAGRLAGDGVALDRVGTRVSSTLRATATVLGSDDLDDGPEKLGLFGLLKALRDPDVQRALALAVRFARTVGKTLDDSNDSKENTRG